MTPDEIREHCRDQMERQGQDAYIVLKRRGKWGKQKHAHLWKGGPKGEILAEFGGMLVLILRARDVVAALDREAARA